MNKISKEEVKKIANLAKIYITEKETIQYSKELSKVLDYVAKLNEIDCKNIKETTQVTGLTNVYREDKGNLDWKADKDAKKNREKLLSNTKDKKDNFVKVKQILA